MRISDHWVISKTVFKLWCASNPHITHFSHTFLQTRLLRHMLDDFALINLVYPHISRSAEECIRRLGERGIMNVHSSSFTTGTFFFDTAIRSNHDLDDWVRFCESNWSTDLRNHRKLLLPVILQSYPIRAILWEHMYLWVEAMKSEHIEFRHS